MTTKVNITNKSSLGNCTIDSIEIGDYFLFEKRLFIKVDNMQWFSTIINAIELINGERYCFTEHHTITPVNKVNINYEF